MYKCIFCKNNEEKLLKCIKCNAVFHKKCIKKWLNINVEDNMLYYCPKCSFVGFNEKNESYIILNEENHHIKDKEITLKKIEQNNICSLCVIC